MADGSEALQGSLFEDFINPKKDPKATSKASSNQSISLSDEELLKDAQTRPRIKKGSQFTKQKKAAYKESQRFNTTKELLPAWSHHNLVDINQLTPVLRHYVELKIANPERILLYRLGDFFECFFEDAIRLSNILELTLTGKEGGKEIGRVPMAGIPHHAAERYCSELIKLGLSVAICDQIETAPSQGSLLKREITRILTPGTILEEGMLTARKNNWLAAVFIDESQNSLSNQWALASADISTGEFIVTEGIGKTELKQLLSQMEASEVIFGTQNTSTTEDWCPSHLHLTLIGNTHFSYPEAELALKKYYQLSTIDGLGLKDKPLSIRTTGGLLNYLRETKPFESEINQENTYIQIPLDRPRIKSAAESLILDSQTRRNLELTITQRDNQFHGSLLWSIDRTLTAMGARCLRRWIEAPLINTIEINSRQKIISTFVKSRKLRLSLQSSIKTMGDLERLAGRASTGHASARDLVAIANGLKQIPRIGAQLKDLWKQTPKIIKILTQKESKTPHLANKVHRYLLENPPLNLNEGGLIQDGVDDLLDGLRNQLDDHEIWLSGQEIIERKNSENPNLKLQYHRTFGYFLSASKAKLNKIPSHWIRKQTLSNEERFITPELKTREGKIFQTKSRTFQREYEIFCQLRNDVGKESNLIREYARSIAALDSLLSLAEVAATEGYCKPKIIESKEENFSRIIKIEKCRHPVVEQLLADETFQPNDVNIGNGIDLIVLTGPNASGKSCYLRQIGLIQLLAQIGSWVPAKEATISIADRIFTRVGAVDDLAAGQSTFMVEMAETAYILNQATKHSLVLLDEIGRGTATFDGLSIAWAVSEFLAKDLRSRTIFATHYHELNTLAKNFKNVANFQVLVEEIGGKILFLHRVIPGGASRSYGIEAARLAGVPDQVIQRSYEVLDTLQKNNEPIKTKL